MAEKEETHQGLYGETFVRAIALAAGLMVAKPEPDIDGIDLQLTLPQRYAPAEPVVPIIEVQVKTWTRRAGTPHALRYPELTIKHYNKLAEPTHVPRYLMLVLVPAVAADWAVATKDRLALHEAAYWARFQAQGTITNRAPRSKYTVSVPTANLVTSSSILDLFPAVRESAVRT